MNTKFKLSNYKVRKFKTKGKQKDYGRREKERNNRNDYKGL